MTVSNRHRTVAALALLALAVLVSGCTVFGIGGDGTTGHSAPGDIDLFATEPVAAEPPYKPVDQVLFDLDGSVVENDTFSHVTYCLYDQNGSVIASEDLGTFETPSAAANVTLETEQVPYYVYVHHPRFSGIDEFQNEILIYLPDRHNYRDGHTDDLPFDTSRMTETSCQPP